VSARTGSFPRRFAATQRFTLGRPRAITVARDGSRVCFLRSPAGDDPNTQLWVFDVARASERLVADAREVLEGAGEVLTRAERARRERVREGAAGIVAYAADPALTRAAFALGGRLVVVDLVDAGGRAARVPRALPAAGSVFDPRPDPTGARVAYVSGRTLRVIDVATGRDREVAVEDGEDVSWGQAEFVAAEEMDRTRGFWWSPDGARLLAARVDVSPVQRWHVADASDPAAAPQVLAYPAAGTRNADVSLAVFDPADASCVDVDWDRETFPYLVDVRWSRAGPPLVVVQSRDQRALVTLELDAVTGRTAILDQQHDEAWVEVVHGVPAWTNDGRLVTARDDRDTRRLLVDGDPVTRPGLQVRGVIAVDDGVLFEASEDPTTQHVWRWTPRRGAEPLTHEQGVHVASGGGDVVVLTSTTMGSSGARTTVTRRGATVGRIASFAELPSLEPRVTFLAAGPREVRTALLLPAGHSPADGPIPVLVDPYGGPHHARVVRARDAFLQSQWFADQGFAVLVADGRGTPGRGSAWERAVHMDLAGPALEDQVDALLAVAATNPGTLDLARVAIRGWSFGGFLAALAVLRRPDVFHAAVAGAPVTDWRLYDTHYTERYLGSPEAHPEAYERSSLLTDAGRLERPLMLIHGLADDNVVAAHTLRLSGELLSAGRPHTVLPLSGVTHMTPQEVVAENLLLLQVGFLRQALGIGDGPSPPGG
jgi:dipeptidyl-peptidase-4